MDISKTTPLTAGGQASEVMDFTPLPHDTAFRVLFVYPNVQRIRTPQLGIAVLSSCVKRIGADTALFDTTAMRAGTEKDRFAETLFSFKPHLIAYSVRTNECALVNELLSVGRSHGVVQILGGPHPTHAPEECIADANALVVGEGEGALMDIVRALVDCGDLTGIANTWVNTDGEVVKTSKRDLIADLDLIPFPDWCLFDNMHFEDSFLSDHPGHGKRFVGAIEGSRGCPFTCTYCSNAALMAGYKGQGRWRREKSPERIVEELNAFKETFNRLDFVYWVDEIFLTGLDRLKKFRDVYKPGVGVPFSIMERPECITEEKVEVMAEAGLQSMAIGLESGDEELRAGLLNRRTGLDVLERAFTIPHRYGVKVHAFTMVGLPGQDEASLMETWCFMRKIKPDTAQFSFFFPLKGTVLYDQTIEMGLYDPQDTVQSYHAESVIKQDEVITPEKLRRYQELFTAYATRQGLRAAVGFHLCRKCRPVYLLLFRILPRAGAFLGAQGARLRNLTRSTPRQAIAKIARNIVELPNSAWKVVFKSPAS